MEKLKKAQYMEQFIGVEFPGHISGVTSFGIFVELENTVEGLIQYSSIVDDYYMYDADRMVAIGESTGKEYTLGQKVDVVVTHADGKIGIVDLNFVEE